jgi:hydroxymethylpyrimidine/phosphomethylpyrimidine kinase
VVLAVGGHDSSGGAGVDADREAIEFAGARSALVITARTVQDERGVRELGARAPSTWSREARAALEPGVHALKLGLLPGSEAVLAAAALVESLAEGIPVVLDPVLEASSGTRFHDDAGRAELCRVLLPLGLIWTPNLPELAELTGATLDQLSVHLEARQEAASLLLRAGASAVVVKGGHGLEEPVLDLVFEAAGTVHRLGHPRGVGPGIRGSGCRFASHLAAGLALGRDLPSAVGEAGSWVGRLIEAG